MNHVYIVTLGTVLLPQINDLCYIYKMITSLNSTLTKDHSTILQQIYITINETK